MPAKLEMETKMLMTTTMNVASLLWWQRRWRHGLLDGRVVSRRWNMRKRLHGNDSFLLLFGNLRLFWFASRLPIDHNMEIKCWLVLGSEIAGFFHEQNLLQFKYFRVFKYSLSYNCIHHRSIRKSEFKKCYEKHFSQVHNVIRFINWKKKSLMR